MIMKSALQYKTMREKVETSNIIGCYVRLMSPYLCAHIRTLNQWRKVHCRAMPESQYIV